MIPDGPINAKWAATIALTFITMLIVVPMYYTLHEQMLLLSRIEHTRESNGFVLRRLRAVPQQDNREDYEDSSPSNDDESMRLLDQDFGEQNPKDSINRQGESEKSEAVEGGEA